MLPLLCSTGNLAARHVRLENPAEPVRYQGVVSAIKETYGLIERADVVDEIYYHIADTKNIPGGLKLGDDVDFCITMCAVSSTMLRRAKSLWFILYCLHLFQSVNRKQNLAP